MAGGHNVSEEDIRRRYTRSLTNLPIAIQQADYTSIFDNSARAGYKKKLAIAGGRITERSRKQPEWIIAALPQEFIEPNENQSIDLD